MEAHLCANLGETEFFVFEIISVPLQQLKEIVKDTAGLLRKFQTNIWKNGNIADATAMSPVSFCTVSFFRSVGLSGGKGGFTR